MPKMVYYGQLFNFVLLSLLLQTFNKIKTSKGAALYHKMLGDVLFTVYINRSNMNYR